MKLRCVFVMVLVASLEVSAETNATDVVRFTDDGRFTVTTLNGITFANCIVRRVEPDGISVSHQKGLAKLYFTELPDELRKRYRYDPAKAQKYADSIRLQQEADQREQERVREEQKQAQERARQAAKKAREDYAEWEEKQKALKLVASRSMCVKGSILQIMDDGALIMGATVPVEHQSVVEMKGFIPLGSKWQTVTRVVNVRLAPAGEPIFVVGLGRGLYDGAVWQGTVYPSGTYSYTTLSGVGKTVQCFTLTPEAALEVLVSEE